MLLCLIFGGEATAQTPVSASDQEQVNKIPEFASRMIRAYPEQNLRYENNAIIFYDGTSIIFDDKKKKSFEEKLNSADIEDMAAIPYKMNGIPGYLEDGGRIRSESFFKKMYGSNAKEVKSHLVNVRWFGSTVKFTSINGAAQQLEKVAEDIQQNHPELAQYMKSSGTFYWRKVRHSEQLSAHCFGIAIDIAVKYSDYWKWKNPKATETTQIEYKNRIPLELAEIFEKYGFIWGGRWYHYDTMHFEYRPEICLNTTGRQSPQN